MAIRGSKKQSKHDKVIKSAERKYKSKGKYVVTNPGSSKNQDFDGHYIDIIVKNSRRDKSAFLIEVETADSINKTEAKNQWSTYNKTYDEAWYLAVPESSKVTAAKLVDLHNLDSCNIITWKGQNGSYIFNNLPE